MRWPLRIAMARAMLSASVRASSATAKATGTNRSRVATEKSGLDRGGRPILSAPMLLMPVCSRPHRALNASATRLPTTMPAIMCGSRGSQRLTSTLASRVLTATAVIKGLMSPNCCNSPCNTAKGDAPRAISRPKKFLTWLSAISTAAPAVKPTTTVCDTKLTSVPKRSRPNSN